MQQQYRIFHWQTQSYSEHKAFGKIYKTLDENIDSFVETFMGKYGRIITSPEFDLEMLNYKNRSLLLISNYVVYLYKELITQFSYIKYILSIYIFYTNYK